VPVAYVSTGGTSLSPYSVATKASVVANALGIFVIIAVAPVDKTEAIPRITATAVKVLSNFMLSMIKRLFKLLAIKVI
jgi:hypothetical protein